MSRKLFKRGAMVMAGAMVALGVATAAAGSASAAPSAGVCNGGSIAPGPYTTLTINGVCTVDQGSVFVTGNLTIKTNGVLIAAFGGSNLIVKGTLTVGNYADLILGCEPGAFICFNDPDQVHGTMATSDSVGKLVGNTAQAMIVHRTNIKGDVKQNMGGGGYNCNSDSNLQGSPDYTDYEDNNVGGSVSVTKVQTCWTGFIRNQVAGSVVWNNNFAYDPDGNEITSNKIGGDLKCMGNIPAPQVGDSSGGPNLVAGMRTGQCQSTLLP
ncbi:MAG TPA: hypothetical protein VGN35_10650 [Jatrophihabitantaceae bacterium]|nr:hypothetical protein [Jatrophihabitantaceae bacterium]